MNPSPCGWDVLMCQSDHSSASRMINSLYSQITSTFLPVSNSRSPSQWPIWVIDGEG